MKKLLIFLALLTSCSSPVVLKVPEPEPKITLSWNKPEWTEFLVAQIYLNFDSLSKANDITKFCNKFQTLTKQEKVKAISELLVGVMYYESGWKPTSQYVESTMGIDAVTKKQIVSEGLFQLSYQDVQWYKFCTFDWNTDKALPIEKRSITDPFKNMECGIKIMALQIDKKGSYTTDRNYWSVLKKKAHQIAVRVGENVEECK